MMKLSWHEYGGSRDLLACCALALACGCTATVDGGTTPGSGAAPAASGGSTGAAPGAGGSSAGTAPQSGGTGATVGSGGTGAAATGGSAGTGAGAAGGTPPVFEDPPPFEPAPGMLRRLTRAQFKNAIRDVFGVEVNVDELDPDSFDGSMPVVGASTVVTAERGVEQYHTAIESAVDAVFSDAAKRAAFIGCTPTGNANDACVRGFVESMGRRAWRRPLDATEIARFVTVAETAATELGSPEEGVRWATVALFSSPNFLYRPELGAPTTGGALRFTDFELASRLAFLVWNSIADDALLDAAESGQLATVEGIRAAAERLLATPAGRESVGNFAVEYLRLDRVLSQAKDPSLFPEYSPALQAGMVADVRGTWEAIALDDRVSAMELFSTPKVVVNSDLAKVYGIDATGLTSTTFELRSLPADGPRLGLLSKAGFLSEFANQKAGSPTLRGKFMQEELLCTPIEPPPGNVNLAIDDLPTDQPMTKRQKLEMHRSNPTCSGCHSMMDPLGLPLETFDAIGRYRTTEQGLTIDPSGDFDEQPVVDAADLGRVVGADPRVAQCLVRKYFAYAMGRRARNVNGSVINELAASFEASGFKLRDLVLNVATSEAFASVAPEL